MSAVYDKVFKEETCLKTIDELGAYIKQIFRGNTKMIMKLLSQLRYIKSWKNAWRLLTRPIKSMELAITYVCNFRCPGCYAEDLKTGTFMSYEDACKIMDKYEPAHINITGGEPLLHKDVYKIIEYGAKKGIIMSMVTNGSLLTEEKLQFLKDSGLNTLQISWGKNYPADNIFKALDAKQKGLNVCLSVTNTKINKQHILTALDFAKKWDFQVLWNLPMGELEKDFDKETYFKYRNLPYVREDNMYWNGKDTCGAGVKKIYVTAKGELCPCDRLHEKFNSYEEMSKVYKAKKKTWCNRLGDIQK